MTWYLYSNEKGVAFSSGEIETCCNRRQRVGMIVRFSNLLMYRRAACFRILLYCCILKPYCCLNLDNLNLDVYAG